MSGYFTGMHESFAKTALWFTIVTGVACIVAMKTRALALRVNRLVARPTIPRAKIRKSTPEECMNVE